jgi:hypothetical protein
MARTPQAERWRVGLAHNVPEKEGDAGVAATAVPAGIEVGAGTTAAAPQHPVPPVAWGGCHRRRGGTAQAQDGAVVVARKQPEEWKAGNGRWQT